MHVAGPFLFSVEPIPITPGSGISALKKGTLRSAFPGAWDRKIAGCGKSRPPSGKKRQQATVCLPASIWRKRFTDRTGDLQFCSEYRSSSDRDVYLPFPLQFLHRHSWMRAVFLMRKQAAGVCLAWLDSFLCSALQRGLSSLCRPQVLLGSGFGPVFPHWQSWSKASSARRLKGATVWIFKLYYYADL